MRFLIGLLSVLLVVVICSQTSHAQIPRMLSYQGVLTDSLGNPKPDGTYSLTFRLYDVESDGTALWTEAKTLSVERGLFSTRLGDQVVFGPNVAFDRQYWLSVQVGGGPELSPRIPLSAVGYSLNSAKADTALYARKAAAPSLVDSARMAIAVPDASITSAKIQNGTIQFVDIGQNGATDGQVIKWNGSAWTAATDVTSGGGTSGGGWTDNGTVVGLTMPSDTVALNTTARLGKLNLNGSVGLNGESGIFFGNTNNFLQATIGENLTLRANNDLKTYAAGGLTMLAADNINIGHLGDASWIKVDNASKRFGVGMGTATSVDDRLHVKNDLATNCWMRVESAHPTNWGQAGLRIKTPQNMWNLRMDTYTNNNIPNGGLSLYSQNGGAEAMTWLMDGKVGIGTINPDRKLHVEGSARVTDTLFTHTVAATEILRGPGVAHSTWGEMRGFGGVGGGGAIRAFDTVRVEAPGPGYLLLLLTGRISAYHTGNDYVFVEYGISTTPDTLGLIALSGWRDLPSSSHPQTAGSVHAVVRVPGRGSYTFFAVSVVPDWDDLDAMHFGPGAFTAVFIPASYGEYNPPPPIDIWAYSTTADQREDPLRYAGSVETRLDALTKELEALRNEISTRAK